jgi:DNA topoisomerase-3
MYRLVIAEKPSVAVSLAAVLNAKKREDGFFVGVGGLVSWCLGHLAELAEADAYDEGYAKWQYETCPSAGKLALYCE